MDDDEVIAKLRLLQALPEDLHWFCPRRFDDDDLHAQDDHDGGFSGGAHPEGDRKPVQEKLKLVEEAKDRVDAAIICLQLLAFETEDMAASNDWYKARLDHQLTKCDNCVRNFHREKKKLMEKLREEHEEHEVSEFSRALGELDLKRIRTGLLEATSVLREAPPEQRGLALLEGRSLFAIFEALSAEAVLDDKSFMRDYFDEPFTLVQSKRQLKLQDYVPAMSKFLFDDNQFRLNWARRSWIKMKTNPTPEDFGWAIHDSLLGAMRRITDFPPNSESLQNFWCAVHLIVDNLDQSLITHSLRALDVDIYRLALDHVLMDSPAVRFILQTLRTLLITSPGDFWDAMGAISPTSIIETICNSPYFCKTMRDAGIRKDYDMSTLSDMLSWIDPCIASIKLPNQPSACRALAAQLMERPQAGGFSDHARIQCFTVGLQVLARTLRGFVDTKSFDGSVGRVVVSEIMEVVSKHIHDILSVSDLSADEGSDQKMANFGMDVIRNTLALDCQCFKIDYENVEAGLELQHNTGTYSQSIWKPISNALVRNRTLLAQNTLIGMMGQFGLEKFSIQGQQKKNPDKMQFNEAYSRLTEMISQIFQRLSEYDPERLDALFEEKETASSLIAGLFAAEQSTYESAVDVMKVVSSNSGRREAISHLLEAFFTTTMGCISWALRRISHRKTFSPTPRMLRTCRDVLDILCNSQDGMLRTRVLTDPVERQMVEALWQYQWQALEVIFEMTERWGAVRDRDTMKEFCRDTMQFAERLFDEYSVFASAIDSGLGQQEGLDQASRRPSKTGLRLLNCPRSSISGLVKWLRLRDEYLVDTSVSLVCKILRRLGEWKMHIADASLVFIENVVTVSGPNAKPNVKTVLSDQQKSELASCLEEHLGRQEAASLDVKQELSEDDVTSQLPVRGKQSTLAEWSKSGDGKGTPHPIVSKSHPKGKVIDLENWRANAKIKTEVVDVDVEEDFGDIPDEEILEASRSVELYKAQQRQRDTLSKKPSSKGTPAIPLSRKGPQAPVKDPASLLEFREKREREKSEKLARDKEQIARQRRNVPGSTEATGALDSRVNGLGVKGKDHAPENIMVSSESEDDDEDALDRDLFGIGPGAKPSRQVQEYRDSKMAALKQAEKQGPVRKARQVRSAKDMRARLAPDLSNLHRTILSWDFFHEGDFPPNSGETDYTLVSNTFRTPNDYQDTFEPLHVLEAWQGFLKAKEENNVKAFTIKIANRLTVDSFVEVSTSMSVGEGRDIGLAEADIVLISKAESPAQDSRQPHCLARVIKINRKKTGMEISYRLNTNNPLLSALSPNASFRGVKLTSLTPLEREYGALRGLQYYDLCDEILNAKPSPILNYSEKQLDPLINNYNVNRAQAKAVRSAIDNDAFTLVQGPPGSGKTKTIVAIVGAILTDALSTEDTGTAIFRPQHPTGLNIPARTTTSKKLLVCAPSNAAVDELVMRFKQGVRTLRGESRRLSVVRLGRSDAINANVVDVTLEELVNKKLNLANGNKVNHGEEIHKHVEESKSLTEQLNVMRARLDEVRSKGEPAAELQREFDVQKRKKAVIGTKLDELRDKSTTAARDADINRRRVQQEVLDGANVLCATLSGSGHDMFQNLNIEFETVIIDEAAQSIELSALIPLKYGCSKCILVGDPKQLPPTVLSRKAAWFQYEQSLFVRMQSNHPKDVHLLDTQYRMHPEISQFPSKAFYDGMLLDGEGMAALRQKPWHDSSMLSPYRFFDVQGSHQSAPKGHSLINVAELNVALQLYARVTTDFKDYDYKGKVGIITPYKSQLQELKTRFSQRYGESIFDNVEFNTTDAFQGRESEIIIFSCVRASTGRGIGFLDDIRRMNVGLTRAKSSLWILGNSQTLLRNEFWGNLVEDARSRDRYTDGDLTVTLRKPTVRQRPQTSDVAPLDRQRSNNAGNGDGDIEMPDASVERSGSSSSDKMVSSTPPPASNGQDTSENKAQTLPGGRWGLDPSKYCGTCGSWEHHGSKCDNVAARTASGNTCYRCREPDHTAMQCTAERCIICGALGHLAPACVSNNPLPKRRQENLKAREEKFQAQRQNSREHKVKNQLGGHDDRVPAVQASRRTPPPEEERKENRGNPFNNEQGKRRREPSPPPPPPPPRLETFEPSKGPSLNLPPKPQDRPISGPANGAGSVKPTNERNAASSGYRPPASRPVAPPRKRKEADPFLRPNRSKRSRP